MNGKKSTPPLVEHKLAASGEIKAASDSNYFEGWGNVSGVFDSYDDMVMPGTWTKTVAERKSKVRILFDHDSSKIIGKPDDLEDKPQGLWVKGMFSATPEAQNIRTLVLEGAVDSMSVGFRVIQADYGEAEVNGQKRYVRYIKEAKLYEVSIVAFPANELATISDAKASGHVERLVGQLENLIAVGIKSGKPMSAESLKRLQAAYKNLGALLLDDQGKALDIEESDGLPLIVEADDGLISSLKNIHFTPPVQPINETKRAVLDEIAAAIRAVKIG